MGHRSFAVVCLVTALALVVVTPAGPVELSYVESGSMEPTIQPGDGYIVYRTAGMAPGDIVTFRFPGSEEYVTHRIVEVTDRGYVTKGDANPSTDQQGGHPYVTESDIVGRVVTVGGEPLVVPHLRALATAVDRYRLPLTGLAVLSVLLAFAGTGRADRFDRTRHVLTRSQLVRTLLSVAVLASFGVLLATMTTGTMTFLAVEDLGPAVDAPTSGEEHTRGAVPVDDRATRNVTYAVSNVPTVDYLVRAEGATVVDKSAPNENGTVRLTLDVPPQDRVGPHEVRVRFVRYLAIFPRPLVSWLADRAVLAVPALSAFLAYLPLYVGYRLTTDPRVPVRLPRSRPVRRWLR